jgi:hypothetical protein
MAILVKEVINNKILGATDKTVSRSSNLIEVAAPVSVSLSPKLISTPGTTVPVVSAKTEI